MNVVICGAGEVGRHLAEVLGREANNITVVDLDQAKLAELDEVMDVRNLPGNGTHADVLLEAGVARADLFVAATQIDEVNLLAASLAKGLGADVTVARIHHAAYLEKRGIDYANHLGIDHLVCPEYSTAQEIAATLRSPGALAMDRFASDRIEMQQIRVADDTPIAGQPLSEVRFPVPGRVASVSRHGEVTIPNANTQIEPGDIVTLIGEASEFGKLAKVFDPDSDRRKRIMIMGGTSQTVWLCRALKGKGFSIRLFERNAARAVELSEKLDWVTVIHADAVNTDALESERVDLADAFLTLTVDDERNILAAARAKSMGASTVIAVLQRGTYLHLLEHVGIDRAFSPRASAVSDIQWMLAKGPVRHLATIAKDTAEVYEVAVQPTAKGVLDTPLKEVSLPTGCFLGAVHRASDEVFVPAATSTLQAGDTVIVIGPSEQRKAIRKLFTGK